MGRILSDAEMQQLEREGKAKSVSPHLSGSSGKRVLTDEEMAALERSSPAQGGESPLASFARKFQQGRQAALESFGNAATFGHLPQLQAAAERALPNPTASVDEKLLAQGFKINQPGSYVEARDQNLARQQQQREEFPVTTGAASVAGALALGGPLGGLAKKAGVGAAKTIGGRLAQGAAAGGVFGAAQNPGDVAGEVNPAQVSGRLSNAQTGAVLGIASQGVIEAVKPIAQAIKRGGVQVGKTLTGVPEQEIQTYSKRAAEVRQLHRQSGGDMAAAADQVREELQAGIRSTKSRLGKQISDALEAASPEPTIPVESIIKKLEDAKLKLNPNFKSEAVAQIDDMVGRIKKEAPKGAVSLRQLNEIKEFLQDQGKSAYFKNGQIFSNAKESQRAAAQAAQDARKALNQLSPEIARANNQLYGLHRIEDSLNKNLIAPGKPEAALLAAGSGGNQRSRQALERLGRFAEVPALEKAENLAAARTFGKPSLLPVDNTGKAVARQVAGGLLGTAVGGPLGGAIGAAATNPAALRAAIDVGRFFQNSPSITAFAQQNPVAFQAVVQELGKQGEFDATGKNRVLDNPRLIELFRQNPELIEGLTDSKLKAELSRRLGRGPAESPMERRAR